LRRLVLAGFLALFPGCAAKRPVALPALFPMATAWSAPVGEAVEGDLTLGSRAVFLVTRGGVVRAIDRASGRDVWTAPGAGPRVLAAEGDRLIARGIDGALASLDPGSGAERWAVATGVKGDLAPALAGDVVYVAGEGLVAVDAASGQTLWTAAESATISARPVLHGACLLLGEADGTLRCRDPRSGASRWTLATRSALVAPPTADAEGRLFLGTTDRRILSVDPHKGKLRWQWKVGADIQSSPTIAGRLVLAASFDAVLYALDAGNGNLAWRTPLPSRPASSPLLARGMVLLACQENEILGFELRTGKRAGGLKTRELLRTAPVIAADRLFVGLRDRTIEALDLPGAQAAPGQAEPDESDRTSERPPKP
jgi:outer membrane protein assembly factor BamB